MNWQHRYRAWLVPYAEGTLDGRRRARLEARLARDPALAAEAEAERRVVARLRAVAQAAESTPHRENLWPGIQSRLEVRRSPVRPLFLVGGLSAAATSLAWAAFWGPLHHPAQPPVAVVATNTAPPNVIVIGPMPDHRHAHSTRRIRHNAEHLAKRLMPTVPEPRRGAEPLRPPDTSRMAHNDVSSPEAPPLTGSDGAAQSPPSAAESTDRFRLATSLRPTGHRDDTGDAPKEQDAVTAPEDKTGLSVESSTEAPDGPNGNAGTATPTPAGTPAQPGHAAKTHRPRRHHRRRSRHSRGVKPAAAARAETADPAGDAASSVEDTPARPNAHKPID